MASMMATDQTMKIFNGVADSYNAAGGIAGRKVAFTMVTPAKVSNNTAKSKILLLDCQAITSQKTPPLAVLGAPADSTMDSCLSKAGITTLMGNSLVQQSLLDQSPQSVTLAPTLTRLAAPTAKELEETGFLRGGQNVAVIASSDTDAAKVAKSSLAPALEKAGAKNAAVYPVSDKSVSDASVRSLVLKLKQDGVDRIVWFGSQAVSWFSDIATQQKLLVPFTAYGPDLEVSLLARYAAGQSASDQAKDVILDWRTATPYNPSQTDKFIKNDAAARKCLSVLDKLHVDRATYANTVLATCEGLNLLKAALEKSGSDAVNAQAISAGLARLTSFDALSVFKAGFGPGRRDGASELRSAAYAASCRCFSYTGADGIAIP